MKRALLFSSGITAIVVGVFALAYLTSAATTKFSFTGRGIVQEHDFSGKNMRLNFTQLSERAKDLGLGKSLDVSAGNAKFYKKDAKGKLRRVKQGNVAVGDEVSLRGSVKSDDRFVASRIVVIDTSFVMKGKLRTYSASSRQMTVDVDTSNFRSSNYVNNIVPFVFSSSLKVYSGGKSKPFDDVTAADQRVQVDGKLVNNTDLEVTAMYEKVK